MNDAVGGLKPASGMHTSPRLTEKGKTMRVFIYKFIQLSIIFALSSSCLAVAGDTPSDDVKKAAREGVNDILKDSRNGGLHHLGFKNQIEIDYADLGDGFQVYTILPEKLLNESLPQDIQYLVSPTNQWQFMVVNGIKAYALLTVDFLDGKWRPVSIGSSELANELNDIMRTWPTSAGYQYKLIRVYQANSNFIELSLKGRILGIIPLTSLLATMSGEKTNTFDPSDLLDPKEILPSLRPVVKRNMELKR